MQSFGFCLSLASKSRDATYLNKVMLVIDTNSKSWVLYVSLCSDSKQLIYLCLLFLQFLFWVRTCSNLSALTHLRCDNWHSQHVFHLLKQHILSHTLKYIYHAHNLSHTLHVSLQTCGIYFMVLTWP
jgi:hypothetical protein